MPQNAIYLQAAFAITVVALAVYVAYVLLRLRQAQDDLRALRQERRSRNATPRDAGIGGTLRSAQEPPAEL